MAGRVAQGECQLRRYPQGSEHRSRMTRKVFSPYLLYRTRMGPCPGCFQIRLLGNNVAAELIGS
jgi:hypothetical protein